MTACLLPVRIRTLPLMRWMAVALLLSCLADRPSAAIDGMVRVHSSNVEELLFSTTLKDPSWRAAQPGVDGSPLWEVSLPGYTTMGVAGGPRVPRSGGWIVVPPGTSPRLEVVAESWQVLPEERPLAIEPIPVMVEDPSTEGYREQPLMPRPGQDLPLDRIPECVLADMQRPDPALAPGPAVRLGEPVWWRGRRIATYTILPLRVEQGHARSVLREGRWRVLFVPDPEAGKNAPDAALKRMSGKNDGLFAGHFLNGALLTRLATEGAHLKSAPEKILRPAARGASLGHPEVRIAVRRTELLRVQASELRSRGLLPETPVRKDQLRLYQRRYLPQLDDPLSPQSPPYLEIEVPIYITGSGDDFDPGDQFLFWGLRPRDDRAFTYEVDGVAYSLPAVCDTLEISNQSNIYWLQLADPDPGWNWARMDPVVLPPADGPPEVSYRRTDYYNEALAYREKVPSIRTDRYFYNGRMAQETAVSLFLWSAAPNQNDAVLEAGVANFSRDARTYRLDLVSDGQQIASLPDFSSSSRDILTYQADLPASVMDRESFSLRFRATSDNAPVFGYLDWVRVSYDARYAAPYGRLLFPGGDGVAVGNLEIPGFGESDIGLIEVTDARNPRFVHLEAANVTEDGDGFMLSLKVDQGAGPRRFFTSVRMSGNGVPDIRYADAVLVRDPVVPTRLSEAGADVLVVVHPEFRTAAESWVEYRRSRAGPQGLTFQVVQPQDLYDWYTGGLKDPWAIKRLVDHGLAHPAWGSWALVLIGSANENPRQIGVPSGGRQWSRDWVPTHFHVQVPGGALQPEVRASDKWFASQSAADPHYPSNAGQPTDLYVGRLPVHTPAELERILAKIQQVENKQPGQDWRRRGVFMADDAYGTGALGGGGFRWQNMHETAFETSQRYLAAVWQDSARVDLRADTLYLRNFMKDLYPEADASDGGLTLGSVRQWCRQSGAPEALITALSRGATLAHFQGHANHWLMTHETWFLDDRRASSTGDVDRLTNQGKPWLFCGMGCHMADFIKNVAAADGSIIEPGLSEKLLMWTDGGAVAAYGSSGYEYLSSNAAFSEVFIRRIMLRPPFMTIRGDTVSSRWMAGELMWATEADLLAQSNTETNRRMVRQYLLLGDPLLRLDAGLPQVQAWLLGDGGGPLPDFQAELTAIDATNRRTVELRARDEAGIDRLLVLDSTGGDLTSSAIIEESPFMSNGSRQIVDYTLSLPVRPFAHDILVRVYDSAAPLDSDAHVLLTFHVRQETAVVIAQTGEPLDPAIFSFVAGQPVRLSLTITSTAWFQETTPVAVAGRNLEVTEVSIAFVDNRTLRVHCTAVIPEGAPASSVDRGLRLTIDGHENYVALQQAASPGGEALISGLVNYPNPMRDGTHFVFSTGLLSGRGRVRIWTVSGREVGSVPFTLSGGGQEMVPWDGRDRRGDRLANGTYLYRVELEGGAAQGSSGMQRLVIMR